jgi:hypothetical protein
MVYRFDLNGRRASFGCGLVLLMGLILLTPLIDFLIEILGWILVVLGLMRLFWPYCPACSVPGGDTIE